MDTIMMYYLFFLLFIAPFHLTCWCIRRFLSRNELDTEYLQNLHKYMIAVLIWSSICGLVAIFGEWIDFDQLVGYFILTAGLFPLYYWKNIFWLHLKNKHLTN